MKAFRESFKSVVELSMINDETSYSDLCKLAGIDPKEVTPHCRILEQVVCMASMIEGYFNEFGRYNDDSSLMLFMKSFLQS
jgi:hypothetical protein